MKTFASYQSDLSDSCGMTLPRLGQALIWLIGLAGLGTLTVRDVLPLFADYTHNNVATHVEVVIIDGSFKPPQPVMCLPQYTDVNMEDDVLMRIAQHLYNGTESECGICKHLTSVSWDIWKEIDLNQYFKYGVDAYYQILSLAFAKKLITQNGFLDHVFDPSLQEILFSAARNFFIWKTKTDYYLSSRTVNSQIDIWSIFDIDSQPEKVEALLVDVLKSICNGLEFSELNFANEFDLEPRTNRTCSSMFLDAAVPFILGVRCFWTPLPFMEQPRTREYRLTFLKNDSLSEQFWFPKPGVEVKPFMLYPDVGIQYLTAQDTLYSSYIFQTPFWTGKRHHITVRYSVQMRAKDARYGKFTCYNGTSATVCLTKCTKRYVIDRCGCVPFSIRTGLDYDPGTPYCTAARYTVCNVSAIPKEVQDSCLSSCKAACEYTSYFWQVDYESHKVVDSNNTELILRMVPMFNTFAEFTWTFKSTPEQFLSQIFGVVNFYLGFSGLSVLTFAITVVAAAHNLRKRGMKPADTRQEVPPVWQVEAEKSKVNQEKWISQLKEDIKNELREEMRRDLWA